MGGAAFSTGAAAALYVWVFVQHATSWHTSVMLAGAFELLVVLATAVAFRVPEGALELGGAKFDRVALRASLASRDLWVYGIALLGGYGAYFTASQLFSEYAMQDRHFSSSSGGLLSALILLAGIPGSLLGGYLADRSKNLRLFVVGPLFVVATLLTLIPLAPTACYGNLVSASGFSSFSASQHGWRYPPGSPTSSINTSVRRRASCSRWLQSEDSSSPSSSGTWSHIRALTPVGSF